MEKHDDLTVRPITGREELDLFNRLPYGLNDELDTDLAEGRRRPEWLWVALRGDRLLARLAWWSRPNAAAPGILDILDVDDAAGERERHDAGTRLLRTAMAATLPRGTRPPEYGRQLPPQWRAHAPVRRAVEERMALLEGTGARLFVERLRLEWRRGSPLPERGGRLAFRPVRDAAELVTLMTSVLDGTLDAHSRADLARMPAHRAALRHYEGELARYDTPRDWWRVATLPDGDPVGFVVPAHNGYNAVIAYIGVLPAHRGSGHVDAILAEGTRVLAEQDVPRIRASTDLANTPMANAFRRAGYLDFEREINMTWN